MSSRQLQQSVALDTEAASVGHVHLVGAGPGDPELLTRKAWRLLQQCDVLIYDALVSAALLAELPPTLERIYVGKRSGQHCVSQQEIGDLIVEQARLGKQVVRLKGGDPLIFGRLREELDSLKQAGIGYSIVPGITAAAGCAASCGFPLTERQTAPGLRLITAHYCDERYPDWSALARRDETLVFYMGVTNAAQISAGLRQHGLPDDWPVLIVEKGTLPEQRIHGTALVDLAHTILTQNVQAPALIYVGQVVREWLPKLG